MALSEYNQRVQQAVIDYSEDPKLSFAGAAAKNDVATSTVKDRYSGKLTKTQTDNSSRKLTVQQENILAGHIRRQQMLFRPVCYPELRMVANLMVVTNNSAAEPVGENWPSTFISRRPELRSRREQALEIERVSASNPDIIKAWFQGVGEILQDSKVAPEDRWNMDEVGARRNHHQSEQVIFDEKTGVPISITSSDTQWTTSLECISATGAVLRPLVIHVGGVPEAPLDKWFPPIPNCPNFKWGFSKKGWTSDEYCIRWFEEIFLPETENNAKPRILFMDAVGSHTTGELQFLAHENNVFIIWLVPHCSHLIQPLDAAPFSRLKAAYSERLKKYDPYGDKHIGRADFDILWAEARSKAFTKRHIKAGWKRTGLYPFSVEKVLSRREVATHRPVTPDLQPEASVLHASLVPTRQTTQTRPDYG